MEKFLKLVKIDVDYCNYLRKFDSRVPYNYGKKESRPFIGVLFKVNKCMYFAPLSSPKPKHLYMKNAIDFMKLDDGKLGIVNFNNMIPVKETNIEMLNIDDYKVNKYSNLLRLQLFYLNRNYFKLYRHSTLLYEKYISKKLVKVIYDRCCDFKLLEEKCEEYNAEYSL